MTHNSQSKTCKKNPSQTSRPQGSIPVIGLAGGIGSGKTLVAEQLAQMGCVVIDVDRLAKQLRDLPQTLKAIRLALGDQFFSKDGQIDDKSLAEHVFGSSTGNNSDSPLARLNSIVHPLVVRRCRELIEQHRCQKDCPAIVLDAPLLFEARLDSCCDAVIFVQADPAVRSLRVRTNRGWSEKQWQLREKAQILLDKKRDMSDYIVENNSSKIDLRCHIQRLFPRILGKTSGVQRKAWSSEALCERSDGRPRQFGD
ncbi:MAG: dephospho-CoA kinase [Actinobacteria bacterium]|nr:dephospho-CoA kinase [Actinomycetota bacterium]